MNSPSVSQADEDQVRQLLEHWARATQKGRQDEILVNHAPDVLIYDVLPPMKYESAAAYRRSWEDWQPDTQGEAQFTLQDLSITTGNVVAFAHCFIKCGGTLPDGKTFDDVVRATFCLRKIGGSWQVAHQHISKPFQHGGGA
ncbi:YybH family protein [Gemmatimonas sp.]|uniref:YybH family protein n=1 Tax=Gemmatimonas sp. TaxID=1962908 RepID=UPI0039830BD3